MTQPTDITDDELRQAEEGIDWPLFRIGLGDDAANFFQRLLQAYKEQKEDIKVWQAGIVDKSLTIAFLSQKLTQKDKIIEMMKEALEFCHRGFLTINTTEKEKLSALNNWFHETCWCARRSLSEVKKMEGS